MQPFSAATLQEAGLLDVPLPHRSLRGRPRLKNCGDGEPTFGACTCVSLADVRLSAVTGPTRRLWPSQLRAIWVVGFGLELCRQRRRDLHGQRGCTPSFRSNAPVGSRALPLVAVHAIGEEDLEDGWTGLEEQEDQASAAFSFDEQEEQDEAVVDEEGGQLEEDFHGQQIASLAPLNGERMVEREGRLSMPSANPMSNYAESDPHCVPDEKLLDRSGPCDAVMVRFQSPSAMRRAATWRDQHNGQHLAEVFNPKTFDKSLGWPGVGGIFCTEAFGPAKTLQRRFQMGMIELAWPSPHVWFTAKRNIGSIVHVAGKFASPTEWLDLRQFKLDVYLGDWTATNVARLRNKPNRAPFTWSPFVGSPTAAETMPRIHQEACSLPATADAPLDSKRTVHALASMMSGAWSRCLRSEVERLSGSVRVASLVTSTMAVTSPAMAEAVGAAAKLDAELPVYAAELLAFQQQARPKDATHDFLVQLHKTLPRIVKQTLGERLQLSPADAKCILTQVDSASQRHGDMAPQLQEAAQRDAIGLWELLTAPGLASMGDCSLTEKLDELEGIIVGHVGPSDRAHVLALTRKLLRQGQAALDIIINASCNPRTKNQAAGADMVASKSPVSRFNRRFGDISWYETSMPVAAFHLEDVDRVKHALNVKYNRTAEASDHSVIPPMTVPAKKSSRTTGSGIRVPPRKKDAGFRSEASFYRRGERSNVRWHVPLHDCERPGRGGGLIPIESGEMIIPQFAEELLRYGAARPRPAALPPSLPPSMEADCAPFVSSGGAGMRSCLGRVDIQSQIRDLHKHRHLLDTTIEVEKYLSVEDRTEISERACHITSFLSKRSGECRKLLAARLEKLEVMASKRQLPEWMILSTLPVLPPDLRSTRPEDGFDDERAEDLNASYETIIKRGDFLRDVLRDRAADAFVRYNKVLFQTAVDNLVDNGRMGASFRSAESKASLTQRLQGKRGRLRGNLLGKRVDYSARTVIVVEPKLRMDQCGLPYCIARVLFETFLIQVIQCRPEIFDLDDTHPRKLLRQFDEMEDVELKWQLLQQAIGHRKVILNRAPTLHRLSMQAFRPILVEGQAMQIHPLICSPFNADFDGDTMTIHLALSEDAQDELEKLMLTSQNLHSPASGDGVIGPTQDMVLGMYYLTAHPLESLDGEEPERECASPEDVQQVATDCHAGELPCNAVVSVSKAILLDMAPDAVEDDAELAGEGADLIKTTAGRILFFLLVHQGWTAPPTSEELLLERMDKAPSADEGVRREESLV